MIRPAALDSWPRDGATYLLLPFTFFFTHTLTGRGREAGRRRGQPQDYALSLQPKKWACLPSPTPSPLTHSSSSTTSRVWGRDGGAVLPPRFPPCQLGSVFAMSISFPDGTGPHSLLAGLLWDRAPCLPRRAQSGPSLQPLC